MHTALNLRPRLPTSCLSFIPRPQNSTEPRRSSKPVFPVGFPVTHLPAFANSVTALSWSPKVCSQGSEPPSYHSAHPFSLCLMYSEKRGWSCAGLSKEARTLPFRPFLGPSSCRKQIQGRQILPRKQGKAWDRDGPSPGALIQVTSRSQVLPSPKTTSRRTMWKF